MHHVASASARILHQLRPPSYICAFLGTRRCCYESATTEPLTASVICTDSSEAARPDSEEAPPAEFVLSQLRVHIRHGGCGQDGDGADAGRGQYTTYRYYKHYTRTMPRLLKHLTRTNYAQRLYDEFNHLCKQRLHALNQKTSSKFIVCIMLLDYAIMLKSIENMIAFCLNALILNYKAMN